MALNTKGLDTFRAGLLEAIDKGVDETADDVVDLASQLAPVDEGDLKETIRKLEKQHDGERTVAAGGISGTHKFVNYAEWVEYGNGEPNYPAQPFMTPAATHVKVEFRVSKQLKALEGKSTV